MKKIPPRTTPCRNPVARHAGTFNRSTVEKNRKRADKQGYQKHRGRAYQQAA